MAVKKRISNIDLDTFAINVKVIQKLQQTLHSFTTSITMVTQLGIKPFGKAIFWSICAHLIVILGIVIIASAISTPFNIGGIFFTYAITTAGAVLLFLLPGSYLGWDALFFGLLVGSAGIAPEYALVIVAVVRIQQLLFMILGGISLNWLLQNSTKSVT